MDSRSIVTWMQSFLRIFLLSIGIENSCKSCLA